MHLFNDNARACVEPTDKPLPSVGLTTFPVVFSTHRKLTGEITTFTLVFPAGTPADKMWQIVRKELDSDDDVLQSIFRHVLLRIDKKVFIIVIHTCAAPGCKKMGADFEMCGRCRKAIYCGPECHQKYWRAHRQSACGTLDP